MTVKDLKKFLRSLPDDAEVFFDLWQSDDKWHHFRLRKSSGRILHDEKGNEIVCIGHADNCIADKVTVKEDR